MGCQFNKTERLKSVLSDVMNNLKYKVNEVRIGYKELYITDDVGFIVIETDCKEYLGDEIESIIQKSEHGIHLETKLSDGFYEWCSDTYFKPTVEVSFTI